MRTIKTIVRPDQQAVEVLPGVWAVPDDCPIVGIGARPTDVPARNDLAGARRGKRLVRNVPSGWPDATIDAQGRLVPCGPDGNPLPDEVPDVARIPR
jgi:hypothetical protein